MRKNFGEVQVIETRPLFPGLIERLLPESEEREERLNLLGDSAGLTEEDIEEKVRRVKGRIQVERVLMTMPFSGLETADVLYLMEENASLRQGIEQIKQKLSELEERIPEEKVIVLREISREEAEQEIRELFSSGRTLYYSDIAEELRLDLELVVVICHKLQESGELRIDESAL